MIFIVSTVSNWLKQIFNAHFKVPNPFQDTQLDLVNIKIMSFNNKNQYLKKNLSTDPENF